MKDMAINTNNNISNATMNLMMSEDVDLVGSQSDVHALKLPGAASLYEQLDKMVIVCLRDGRNFYGWLRSFDQYANLTLDNTIERITIDNVYSDIGIGIFVIRGENVMMLAEVDEQKDQQISSSMKLVSENEIRKLIKERKNDNKSLKWPIPEEM